MRLLDRYFLRELIAPFGYCLGGFLVFWIASDVLNELPSFQKLKLDVLDVGYYYMVKAPEFLVMVMPIALLLALLYTLTNLARHNEITAVRAAGVSLFRLASPYFAIGVALTGAVFAVNELWIPRSSEAADEILNRYQASKTAVQREREENVGFFAEGERRNWFITEFHVENHTMRQVIIDDTEADGTRMKLVAERGWRETNTWVFTNVIITTHPAGGGVPMPALFPTFAAPQFSETPGQILSEIKMQKLNNPKFVRRAQLSIQEILDYKRLHPGGSGVDAKLNTKLHGRIAGPWTCLVVVMIALPFGAASGRRNVFAGVAVSIVICFAYFVVGHLALTLGSGGFVPGWIAAWAPNALFAAAGIAMTLRVR